MARQPYLPGFEHLDIGVGALVLVNRPELTRLRRFDPLSAGKCLIDMIRTLLVCTTHGWRVWLAER